MKTINAYLTFNGNCKEAMIFYQKCLGGELIFQTMEDSPLSGQMPKKMKNCILQVKLENEGMILLGTDMVPETGLIKGNAVSLVLNCTSEKEIRSCFKKLSNGGELTAPLKKNFQGNLLGSIRDKYGKHWLLAYSGKVSFVAK